MSMELTKRVKNLETERDRDKQRLESLERRIRELELGRRQPVRPKDAA